MQYIQYQIEFYFDPKNLLRVLVNASFAGERINLSHSAFLLFLYQKEGEIEPSHGEFAYRLAKYLRSYRIEDSVHQALIEDEDMAWFFSQIQSLNIPVEWKTENGMREITFSQTLPIRLILSQVNHTLICTMPEHKKWLSSPFDWLTFRGDKDILCFLNGTIVANPPEEILGFLDGFIEHDCLTLTGKIALQFIQKIYTPNKEAIQWEVTANLDEFVPKDEGPLPKLTIELTGDCLQPHLSYLYGDTEIFPDDAEEMIRDKTTGAYHNRMKDMEHIYQQDLMDLFLKYDIPFLLQNPGDIGNFLEEVLPVLTKRDWVIVNNAVGFKLSDTPLEFQFSLDSPEKDWFAFDRSTTIDGKEMQFQEIARLMIDNQGYIKTTDGYAKVSSRSKKELETLANLGAFQHGKTFNKRDILPLIAMSQNIEGKTESSKSYLASAQSLQKPQEIILKPTFKGTLRDYQQYGLQWLHFLYTNEFGGILADDMGLGKTVQTIAFVNSIEQKSPVLVVGPTNVVYNWESEIKKFSPDKLVCVYSGGNRHQLVSDLGSYDYIVTSYGVLKNDIEILKHIPFEGIFADEAQHIKNPNTQLSKAIKQLQSRFKVAMTGTPIENHLQDLWNIFDFAMPEYLGSHKAFENAIKGTEKTQLRNKIKPFVLRREKKEVLTSLPDKTEIILKCEMSDAQKQLYETVLSAAKQGIKDSTGKLNRLNILTSLLKLRQVCVHPGLLPEIDLKSVPSSKFDLMQEKISELIDEGHKVVLFSQFTSMLDLIQEWTDSQKIPVERIDGSVSAKKRLEAVERFQQSDLATLFIVSLKAGGVGLNLTAADYVIHMDPWWNPAIESQATDRVHRMGQQNKVIVYKMITAGTIEEKIQDLQSEKRALLSQIIDIDTSDNGSFNMEEITSLLA